jgi:uncharacterized protein
MKMDRALVDSSFLYANFDPRDRYHKAASAFLAQNQDIEILIPDITLPEAAFLMRRNRGVSGAAKFLSEFGISSLPLIYIEHRDFVRAGEVMSHYRTAQLDFVDCCIVALAERLNITRICTFDQRDFRIIRPTHADFLDIVP